MVARRGDPDDRPAVDLDDPWVRGAVRAAQSVRHYLPLYAVGVAMLLVVSLVPSVEPETAAQSDGGAGIYDSPSAGQPDGDAAGGSPVSATTSQDPTLPGALDPAGRAQRRPASSAGSSGPGEQTGEVLVGGGVTRAGLPCEPGARQLPFSLYAAPCIAEFGGDNGGETYRGVTAETIKIVLRYTADSDGPQAAATEQILVRSGLPDYETMRHVLDVFVAYFNTTFELYGRRVVLEEFRGQGNATEETQGKGQEGACADATAIADGPKPFAVMSPALFYGVSAPFAECAAAKGIFIPIGAFYYAEPFLQRWHPYVWSFPTECERTAHDMAEYIGKRLAGKKAKWAKDPLYQQSERVFGLWIPDNDAYAHCGDVIVDDLKERYGVSVKLRYDYVLDVSTIPNQAATAVAQFKAAGVTDLILATEFISPIFLTQQARAQRWGPEWLLFGTALQDLDGNARLYDQDVVDGHMFGLSQLAGRKINDQSGEAYQAWKLAAPDEPPPEGMATLYYLILNVFNMLQASGPTLTPANAAAGIRSMPPGGSRDAAMGIWSYADDHTAIDDSREIYWVGSADAGDGQRGAFFETYGGRRFRSGEWPQEEPPVYPG